MQTLGLAEFRTTPDGGLVLQSYRLTELLADPAADASRLGQVKLAVSEMVSTAKASGARVNYAIPAQSVFTRFVKLPAVGEEKVEQIIQFEAQQNVPFPIDEVVWDYQLVGAGGDASRMEVVLVAIKADLLDDVNNSVEESGLRASIVDVAPMALYNAFRYNYSDMSGCSLVIDIGARTTNLIFVEPQKVFSRSIPIGGTTITGAIAKDFNEPFADADARKKRDGFVSLGGAYAEPSDPDVARVSKMIRNTMTRLHAEISRSISFYRAQQQGSQPSRIFLCGGSSSLPYMREFFQEKLNMPIEFFNALRNVAVGPGVDTEEAGRSAHVLGELVGLSLRSISDCPMELNLQPASVARRESLAARRPYLLLAAICLLLSLAGWWLYFSRAATVKNAVLDRLTPQVAALKGVEGRMNALRQEMKTMQQAALPLVQATEAREYWLRLIDDIHARMPAEFIWATLFEPVEFVDGKPVPIPVGEATGGTPSSPAAAPPPRGGPGASPAKITRTPGVRLRGLYLDNPRQAGVIDDLIKALQESPLIAKVTASLRSTPTQTEWAYPYELHIELKKAMPQ
jgi:type IV pilus assembly protein PilM